MTYKTFHNELIPFQKLNDLNFINFVKEKIIANIMFLMKLYYNVCYEIKKESIYRFYKKSDNNRNNKKIRKINGINEYNLSLYQFIDNSKVKIINKEMQLLEILQ